MFVEAKDFEELQQQKSGDMPKSASYDNFQNIAKKNLDIEFSELIENIKVWRDGELTWRQLINYYYIIIKNILPDSFI